jgi:hypothetical protein
MRRRHKRIYRKQPRRLTPPLFLHGNDGTKEVVEVDQEFVTGTLMRSTCTKAYLLLSDGLVISVGSRCINKRRIPIIRISPVGHVPKEWQAESPTFSEIKQRKENNQHGSR